MSVYRQEHGTFYFACACGVCGPVRWQRLAAAMDERAHGRVCTARKESA